LASALIAGSCACVLLGPALKYLRLTVGFLTQAHGRLLVASAVADGPQLSVQVGRWSRSRSKHPLSRGKYPPASSETSGSCLLLFVGLAALGVVLAHCGPIGGRETYCTDPEMLAVSNAPRAARLKAAGITLMRSPGGIEAPASMHARGAGLNAGMRLDRWGEFSAIAWSSTYGTSCQSPVPGRTARVLSPGAAT
jgi:hypothetical protein